MRSYVKFLLPIILLWHLLLIPPQPLANEGGWIATSDIPGELWIIVQMPYDWPPWPIPQTKPRLFHSTDYGHSFTQVNDYKVSNIQCQRTTHTQTYWKHDETMTLMFTHDNSQTFHETIDFNNINFNLIDHTWIRDTDNLTGITFSNKLSSDTLRTYTTILPEYIDIDPLTRYDITTGWSPGDLCAVLRMRETGGDSIFYGYAFSEDYETFHYRSTNDFTNIGTHQICCGVQPGEVYHINEYLEFIDVSLDTMRTWERYTPEFNQLYPGTFAEIERGWSPGELFYYYYSDYPEEEATGLLWFSSDFGQTWEMIYDARYANPVSEPGPSLPSDTRLSIYPNPGNGQFRVHLPENAVEVNVYNLTGRHVLRVPVPSPVHMNEVILSLDNRPSGTYFVVVDQNQYQQIIRKITMIR